MAAALCAVSSETTDQLESGPDTILTALAGKLPPDCTFKTSNHTGQFPCKKTSKGSCHKGTNLLSVFTPVSFSPSQPAYEERWEFAEGWREEGDLFSLCLQGDSRASACGSRG